MCASGGCDANLARKRVALFSRIFPFNISLGDTLFLIKLPAHHCTSYLLQIQSSTGTRCFVLDQGT